MPRLMTIIVLSLFIAPTVAWAQDAKKDDTKPAAEAKVDGFASVFKVFSGLEDQLNAIAKKYTDAPAAEREGLMKDYQVHLANIRAMVPKLRQAAVTEYTMNPNKSEDVTETLVGLLANHVRNDEYEQGLEVAELLIKNKCEVKGIQNFAGIAYYSTEHFEKAKASLAAAEAAKAMDRVGQQIFAEIDSVMKNWKIEAAIRAKEAKTDDLPRVKMTTSKGDVTIELLENEAPQAVANFVSLVEKNYYDGLTFHRVLPGFMAQGGCPDGTGSGGPGYNIYCECDKEGYRRHYRGTLSMAHAGKDTGGSQFFLTFRPTTHLDGRHTVFGRVVEGMDVLAKIQRRDPQRRGQPDPDKIVKAVVLRKRPGQEYQPTKVK